MTAHIRTTTVQEPERFIQRRMTSLKTRIKRRVEYFKVRRDAACGSANEVEADSWGSGKSLCGVIAIEGWQREWLHHSKASRDRSVLSASANAASCSNRVQIKLIRMLSTPPRLSLLSVALCPEKGWPALARRFRAARLRSAARVHGTRGVCRALLPRERRIRTTLEA